MNPYMNWINFYSNLYGVDPELARRMTLRESNFNPTAVSPKGAYGLMQLMPGTAADMGVDPANPEDNIKGGIKYYAQQRDKYGPVGALYAYNWGPGNYSSYLKGDIKNVPEETRKYVDALARYADSNTLNAPMDMAGNAGIMPQIMPVQAPQVLPQQAETPKMDDYEQMKIFNPYVQMALGILAGNTGQNKSEAFANAMQGGLKANVAGQEALDRARKTALEKKQVQMKQDEYERLRQGAAQTRAFATSMYKKGGPMADTWKGIAESEDPDAIMKMRELETRMQYNDMMGNYYTGKNETTKPNAYSLPTEADVKNANSLLQNDPKFGNNYEGLSPDQKKALATQYATAAKRLADMGDPDPWNNAKSIVGQLPESKQWGLDKMWSGAKEIGGEIIKPFKDILGW